MSLGDWLGLACGAEILKLELKYRDFDGGRWWGEKIGRRVYDPTGKSHGRKCEPMCSSKSPAAMVGGVCASGITIKRTAI
jgi:hypothetical protein